MPIVKPPKLPLVTRLVYTVASMPDKVIIYIGAITVLFLFAIMLTQGVNLPTSNQFNKQWIPAAIVAVATLATLVQCVGD